MNLVSLLFERALLHPDRIALVDSCGGKNRSVSYHQLTQKIGAAAKCLDEMGLKRGQVVLVFQPVSIELYVFLLGCFHAGIQVMLADPFAGRKFLSNCCQRLMPDAFFGPWKAQCLRLTVAELRKVKLSICSSGWFPATKSWHPDSAISQMIEVDECEPALVTFTSGSTGIPKAAVRSHGFLLAQHRALAKAMEFEQGEVDLITLPVFVLANLASGLTSVLAATNFAKPSAPNVEAIMAQCEKFHVTRCAASPAFFEGFLRSNLGIPNFKKLYTGGAPVFPDLLRRLQAVLPYCAIHSVYGSTEAEPIADFSAENYDDEITMITRQGGGLCSGFPVPEIDLKIISDHWGTSLGPMSEAELFELTVPRGHAGEIIVSGDHVLQGYLGGMGDGETKIRVNCNIWHRTGDAGRLDSEGRVWLLGRCAEKLRTDSTTHDFFETAPIYPFAIECALRELFPNIRMAAIDFDNQRTLVVGKKCDVKTAAAITSAAKPFGVQQVIFLKKIPLDPRHHAKIDYPTLRKMLKR